MKIIKLFLLSILFFIFNSCQQKTPDNYGIYIEDKGEFYLLNHQNTLDRGTMIQSLKGIKGASGFFIKSINSIIVYDHGIDPNIIKLSRLEFLSQKRFQNLFGPTIEEVNLWIAAEKIKINISPIEKKPDMYRITFDNPLEDGFYCVHFESLDIDSSPFNKLSVYDFVIGSEIESFKSIEEEKAAKAKIDATNDSIMSAEARKLLSKVNLLYNEKSFNDMRLIQKKENGGNFNNYEWSNYIKGLDNWHSIAGEIISSKIIRQQINGNIGNFFIHTEYEKTGFTEERFNVIKIDSDFYITYIGK